MTLSTDQTAKPFAVEDKSLEQVQTEVKSTSAEPSVQSVAPAETPAGATARVKMLHHASHDGTQLRPGDEYDLPFRYAAALVVGKRATAVTND